MQSEIKMISIQDVVQHGLNSARATRRPTLLIIGLGMILPQLLLSLLLDVYAAGTVIELRQLFTLKAGAPGSFDAIMQPAVAFAERLGLASLLLFLIILVSYFALVHLAVHERRGDSRLGFSQALRLGVKTSIPSGLLMVLCLFFLSVIGQVLIVPAVLIGVLSLIVPTILVAEQRGVLVSLREALTMRYARREGRSAWAVIFTLLAFGSLFYLLLASVAVGSDWLLHADEYLHLGRGQWSTPLTGTVFGPVYLAVSLLESTLSMALLGLLPALTTAFYFGVARKRLITQV